MLTILRKYTVNLYKTYIIYQWMDLNKTTFIQHYWWPNLRDNIRTHVKVCKTCHKNKKQNLKYGKLTAKKEEYIPWDTLLVNLICPYESTREDPGESIIL